MITAHRGAAQRAAEAVARAAAPPLPSLEHDEPEALVDEGNQGPDVDPAVVARVAPPDRSRPRARGR